MKNAAPRVGLEPTTVVTLSAAHRAIHMRQVEGDFGKKWLELIAMHLNYWPFVSVYVGFGWLVGLSPSDICCCPFGRPGCYNVMNLQLGNCPILAV